MCDWIIEKMPWLVEHVGNLPLPWQITLAVAVITALTVSYFGLQIAANAAPAPKAKNTGKPSKARYNWTERWRRGEDYEERALDWVDPEKVEPWDED